MSSTWAPGMPSRLPCCSSPMPRMLSAAIGQVLLAYASGHPGRTVGACGVGGGAHDGVGDTGRHAALQQPVTQPEPVLARLEAAGDVLDQVHLARLGAHIGGDHLLSCLGACGQQEPQALVVGGGRDALDVDQLHQICPHISRLRMRRIVLWATPYLCSSDACLIVPSLVSRPLRERYQIAKSYLPMKP